MSRQQGPSFLDHRLFCVYNRAAMSPVNKRSKVRSYTRASEVGQYVYCARAWWLGAVQQVRPVNVKELRAGRAAHRRHGRQVVGYHRLRGLGYSLLLAALLLVVVSIWMVSRG